VVNRIGKNGVAVAFETLRLSVSQIRQIRSKSVKVVSRWSNLTKCDVFAQWCKKTREHMQTKFISIKVVAPDCYVLSTCLAGACKREGQKVLGFEASIVSDAASCCLTDF